MDTNKTLDLTGMSDYEIATIKQGYEHFMNGKDFRYFGAILNKKDLKRVNRAFNYTDTRSWIKKIKAVSKRNIRLNGNIGSFVYIFRIVYIAYYEKLLYGLKGVINAKTK